jgi:hypothetical protein
MAHNYVLMLLVPHGLVLPTFSENKYKCSKQYVIGDDTASKKNVKRI